MSQIKDVPSLLLLATIFALCVNKSYELGHHHRHKHGHNRLLDDFSLSNALKKDFHSFYSTVGKIVTDKLKSHGDGKHAFSGHMGDFLGHALGKVSHFMDTFGDNKQKVYKDVYHGMKNKVSQKSSGFHLDPKHLILTGILAKKLFSNDHQHKEVHFVQEPQVKMSPLFLPVPIHHSPPVIMHKHIPHVKVQPVHHHHIKPMKVYQPKIIHPPPVYHPPPACYHRQCHHGHHHGHYHG